MGYLSNYNLMGVINNPVDGRGVDVDDLQPFLDWILENTDQDGHFIRILFSRNSIELKWYEWEDDMKRLSAAFPGNLFIINRSGEDEGDLEQGYFMNGRSTLIEAEITYPEPNWAYLEQEIVDSSQQKE